MRGLTILDHDRQDPFRVGTRHPSIIPHAALQTDALLITTINACHRAGREVYSWLDNTAVPAPAADIGGSVRLGRLNEPIYPGN